MTQPHATDGSPKALSAALVLLASAPGSQRETHSPQTREDWATKEPCALFQMWNDTGREGSSQ